MPTVMDFEQPFYGLERQGTDANPNITPTLRPTPTFR